jgi:hypothetical protein
MGGLEFGIARQARGPRLLDLRMLGVSEFRGDTGLGQDRGQYRNCCWAKWKNYSPAPTAPL